MTGLRNTDLEEKIDRHIAEYERFMMPRPKRRAAWLMWVKLATWAALVVILAVHISRVI